MLFIDVDLCMQTKLLWSSGKGASAGVTAHGFEPLLLRNLHMSCSIRDRRPLHGEPPSGPSDPCSLRSLVWTTTVGSGYSVSKKKKKIYACMFFF